MQNINWVPFICLCFPSNLSVSSTFISTEDNSTYEIEQKQKKQKKQTNQKKWKAYLQIFQQELTKNMEKYDKKKWDELEDQTLIQLRKQGHSWVEISKQILKTNPQICKRRYVRLLQTNRKWPKSIDELIKKCYEEDKKDWPEIHSMLLNRNCQDQMPYNVKRIKQRYFQHLRPGIQTKDWTIEEDILLLNLIRENGKKWKELTCNFSGRTELQLKNRFNGTLKPIQKRVLRKLNNKNKKNKFEQDKLNQY